MLKSMRRYNDLVGVCVHGSIFASPLDWYFERTSVFSARQALRGDRFINLAGTGTFACKLSKFPIKFLDVMPRTMCDLQISMKALKFKIPLVSIKRRSNWLSSIAVDSALESGVDYWTRMLMNDEGRTKVAQKQNWDFHYCKDFIIDTLKKTNVPIHDSEKLIADGYDADFIIANFENRVPDHWNPENSTLFYLRKYQYYASLLCGEKMRMKRNDILRSPQFSSLKQLKSMALECKKQWESKEKSV